MGIEIECEGARLQPVLTKYWNTEADGSLRGEYPHGCCEFVSNGPLPKGSIKTALTSLFNHQKDAEFKFSIRTSVHIHVNVGMLTSDQVFAMVYTYLLYENVLMRKCGDTRIGNRFCLRIEDADGALQTLCKLIGYSQGQLKISNPHDVIRYSSVNIESLWKYGSIEFRGMEGNSDVNRIHDWALTLLAIRDYALKLKDIRDVFNSYLNLGPEGLFDLVFPNGDGYKYPGWVDDVHHSFSITMELPYSYKEHEEVVENKRDDVVKVNLVKGLGVDQNIVDDAVLQANMIQNGLIINPIPDRPARLVGAPDFRVMRARPPKPIPPQAEFVFEDI